MGYTYKEIAQKDTGLRSEHIDPKYFEERQLKGKVIDIVPIPRKNRPRYQCNWRIWYDEKRDVYEDVTKATLRKLLPPDHWVWDRITHYYNRTKPEYKRTQRQDYFLRWHQNHNFLKETILDEGWYEYKDGYIVTDWITEEYSYDDYTNALSNHALKPYYGQAELEKAYEAFLLQELHDIRHHLPTGIYHDGDERKLAKAIRPEEIHVLGDKISICDEDIILKLRADYDTIHYAIDRAEARAIGPRHWNHMMRAHTGKNHINDLRRICGRSVQLFDLAIGMIELATEFIADKRKNFKENFSTELIQITYEGRYE